MIAEPVTTLTDLILAAQGFGFGHFLFWKYSKQKSFVRSWALVFLFLGFSAFFGAVAHGAAPYFENIPFLLLTWPSTIFSIITASFFLHMAWIEEYFPTKKNILYPFVIILTLFFYLHVFGFLNILTPNGNLTFLVAILSYLPAILLHLFLNIVDYLQNKKLSASFVFNGILLTLFGTLIQVMKIAPHQHFNHNDLYHVIQMIALTLIYIGIKKKSISDS